MKAIIFNDTQNFNGSLNLLNERFNYHNKRFWNYKKYIPFLMEKINSLNEFNEEGRVELKKVYFYEGRYSRGIISTSKWFCNKKIQKLNQMISKEENLLRLVSQASTSSRMLRKKVTNQVNEIKRELEKEKANILKYIKKQSKQSEGQRSLFQELESNTLIDIKSTPLKQKEGEIFQKGVDVLLTTDLVNLAHLKSYDIAIVLSGDTDMIEAIKLIRSMGKTVIIVSYHTPGEPEKSNISDLMSVGKFINMKSFTNEEIENMSDLRISPNS